MVWGGVLLWLHLMGTIFWVGGQLFLVAVVLPVSRGALAADERTRLVGLLGRSFAPLASVALALLVVTGALLAVHHGVSWQVLIGTTWGEVLLAKAAAVGLVLILTVVHGAYYGRRLEQLAASRNAGDATWRRLQRQSARLSAINLLLNLLVVALAVGLALTG